MVLSLNLKVSLKLTTHATESTLGTLRDHFCIHLFRFWAIWGALGRRLVAQRVPKVRNQIDTWRSAMSLGALRGQKGAQGASRAPKWSPGGPK